MDVCIPILCKLPKALFPVVEEIQIHCKNQKFLYEFPAPEWDYALVKRLSLGGGILWDVSLQTELLKFTEVETLALTSKCKPGHRENPFKVPPQLSIRQLRFHDRHIHFLNLLETRLVPLQRISVSLLFQQVEVTEIAGNFEKILAVIRSLPDLIEVKIKMFPHSLEHFDEFVRLLPRGRRGEEGKMSRRNTVVKVWVSPKMDAWDCDVKKWYTGVVMDQTSDAFKLHYLKFHWIYDDWVKKSWDGVKPLGSHQRKDKLPEYDREEELDCEEMRRMFFEILSDALVECNVDLTIVDPVCF